MIVEEITLTADVHPNRIRHFLVAQHHLDWHPLISRPNYGAKQSQEACRHIGGMAASLYHYSAGIGSKVIDLRDCTCHDAGPFFFEWCKNETSAKVGTRRSEKSERAR